MEGWRPFKCKFKQSRGREERRRRRRGGEGESFTGPPRRRRARLVQLLTVVPTFSPTLTRRPRNRQVVFYFTRLHRYHSLTRSLTRTRLICSYSASSPLVCPSFFTPNNPFCCEGRKERATKIGAQFSALRDCIAVVQPGEL